MGRERGDSDNTMNTKTEQSVSPSASLSFVYVSSSHE